MAPLTIPPGDPVEAFALSVPVTSKLRGSEGPTSQNKNSPTRGKGAIIFLSTTVTYLLGVLILRVWRERREETNL